jgi:hypothetical protein
MFKAKLYMKNRCLQIQVFGEIIRANCLFAHGLVWNSHLLSAKRSLRRLSQDQFVMLGRMPGPAGQL